MAEDKKSNVNKSINATLMAENARILALVHLQEPEELEANVTKEVNNVFYDYMTGLVMDWYPIARARLYSNTDSEIQEMVEDHKKKLAELCNIILRLFTKANNADQCEGYFLIVEAKSDLNGDNLRTREAFIAGFDQFIESNRTYDQFFNGKPLTYRYLLDQMLDLYLYKDAAGNERYDLGRSGYFGADGKVVIEAAKDTVEASEKWKDADYILLSLYREVVKEARAYVKKDGGDVLIEYKKYGDELPTISAFRKKMSKDTGVKWVQGEKQKSEITLYKENSKV